MSRSASPAEVAAATANAATHSLLTTTSEPTEWSSTGGGETTPVGPAARTPPLCGAHSTAARKTSSSIKAWMSLWQRPETQPSDETTSSLGAKKGGGVTSGDVSIQETNVPTDNSRDRQDLTNTETTEEPPTCATLGHSWAAVFRGMIQLMAASLRINRWTFWRKQIWSMMLHWWRQRSFAVGVKWRWSLGPWWSWPW